MRSILETRRFVAPALAALLAAGCGGAEDGAEAGGEEQAPTQAFPVDAATAGSISGTVSFEGAAPEAEPIDMAAEPVCADQYETTPTTQAVVVNDNGTLANVFVRVTEGPHTGLEFPTPTEPVQLDQEGCRYAPHVLGIQTNQTLEILNSDGILHNINAQPQNNRGFNISQPVEMTSTRTFPLVEVMIPVQCDVHGWMSAYIGVLEHPYHSVSDGQGAFSIDRLPPGDYVLEAWHERYGTATTNVTVASGETATAAFTFSADMAENAVVPLGEPIDLHDHGAAVSDRQ